MGAPAVVVLPGSRTVPTVERRGEDADRGGLRSVAAALDVLDCFAADDELGVSDIARRLGVAKSTAHRLLTTLCAHGLTEKNQETGQYRLGLRLYELGQITVDRNRLRAAARPLLAELRQLTGHTVHLAVASGADVVYLERMESVRSMPLLVNLGRRWPAHTTCSGKVLAAFDPALAAARRLAGFPRACAATIGSAAEWDRALADIRAARVGVTYDEPRPGITSVGAPVLDRAGRARASVSIVGAAAWLDGDVNRTARLVTVATRRLAALLPA